MSSIAGGGAEPVIPLAAFDRGAGASTPPETAYGITYARRLDAFADVWPGLGEEGEFAAHFFQRRDWLEVWLAAIANGRRVKPLFVRVDDASEKPLMLLPLMIEKRHGLRVLAFLDAEIGCCNAPVLFPGASELGEQAMWDLWRRLCQVLPPFDVAILSNMPYAVGEAANPLRRLPCRPMRRPSRCGADGGLRRNFGLVAQQLTQSDVRELIQSMELRPPGWLTPEELLGWAAAKGYAPADSGCCNRAQGGTQGTKLPVRASLPLLQASLPVTFGGRALVGAVRAQQSLAQSQVGRAYSMLRARAIAGRMIGAIQKLGQAFPK